MSGPPYQEAVLPKGVVATTEQRSGVRTSATLRLVFTALALAATLALAACGGDGDRPPPPVVDTVWLQESLTARMARQTGAEVERMTCPAVVPGPGRRLECSAAFDGDAGVVDVTLLGAGPRPAHRARLRNLLLGALERAVQARLQKAGFPAYAVDCPGPVLQRRGRVSRCRVEDRQGRRVDVRVTQVDDRGEVRIQPLSPAQRRPR